MNQQENVNYCTPTDDHKHDFYVRHNTNVFVCLYCGQVRKVIERSYEDPEREGFGKKEINIHITQKQGNVIESGQGGKAPATSVGREHNNVDKTPEDKE